MNNTEEDLKEKNTVQEPEETEVSEVNKTVTDDKKSGKKNKKKVEKKEDLEKPEKRRFWHKMRDTAQLVIEATEKFRLEAEYEEPDRPEDIPYDAIQLDKEEKNPETDGWVYYLRIFVNLVLFVISLVLIIVFVPRILKYFMPFVIAGVISLIATPIVKFFNTRLKIAKKVSSILVIILVLGAIVGIIWGLFSALRSQVYNISENKDAIIESVRATLSTVEENLGDLTKYIPDRFNISKILSKNDDLGDGEKFSEAVTDFIKDALEGIKLPDLGDASNAISSTVGVVFSVIVGFISAFFFTSQRDEITEWLKKIVPSATQDYYNLIRRNFKKALGGYFKAQFKIMLILFVVMFIWLQIMDVPYSALVALGIAFLDFLPVFGMGAVFWPWIAIDIFIGRFKEAILIAILNVISQLIRQVLQPKLVGDAVEMNPIATLFCMFIGYTQGGVIGLIVAIPVGMILISLYKIGTFDRIIKGIKVMAKAINDFRKY